MGLEHFDEWASTFGEVVNSFEIAPDGSGFRTKARFAQFFNIPELMTLFKEVADIKTSKMGAGMNVQDKLIALHHLDCPWRPSDIEQREGRILRQGNQNAEVEIYSMGYVRYV